MKKAKLQRIPGHVNRKMAKHIGYEVEVLEISEELKREKPNAYIFVQVMRDRKIKFWCSEIDIKI